MTMWPQALVVIFFVFVTVMSFIKHGEVSTQPYDRIKSLWITLWMVLVLGAGGFWSPR